MDLSCHVKMFMIYNLCENMHGEGLKNPGNLPAAALSIYLRKRTIDRIFYFLSDGNNYCFQ
jgi:hypothetical protein